MFAIQQLIISEYLFPNCGSHYNISRMANEKETFFENYAYCASVSVLEEIWEAKINNAIALDISYKELNDLRPLEELVNLQVLEVSDTNISDLSALTSLVKLQILDVAATKISDLSPLKGLINLQRLIVSKTQISDLSPLKAFIEKGMEYMLLRGIKSGMDHLPGRFPH